MITVQLKGGLGNQLFQYAFAKSITKTAGLKTCFDISYFKHKGQFELEKIGLNCQVEIGHKNGVLFSTLDPFLKYFPSFGKNIIEPRNGSVVDIQKIADNSYCSGYWQQLEYVNDVKQALLSELIIDLPFYYFDYEKECKTKKICAMHVRRGDYVSKRNKRIFGELTNDYYLLAENLICKKEKIDKIYIFSNDIEWVKQNLQFNFPTEYMNSNEHPFYDILAMTKATYLVIPNSTFSWWAAYLAQNKLTIVPKSWGKITYLKNINICKSEWLKI